MLPIRGYMTCKPCIDRKNRKAAFTPTGGSVVLALLLLCCAVRLCEAAGAAGPQGAFERFCQNRIQCMQRSGTATVQCRKTGTGYTAEYAQTGTSFETQVKRTGRVATPYIGILKYREKNYVCTAATAAAARQGPFTCSSECPVTEIFIYKNGKWVD